MHDLPNWKVPGKDGVEVYWIKDLSNLLSDVQINKILMEDDSLPTWMTHGHILLYQ